MFPEIESCFEAYYGLVDDCREYPEWKKKVEKELGSSISYLYLTIDDVCRDEMVAMSPIMARFDADKQFFFK